MGGTWANFLFPSPCTQQLTCGLQRGLKRGVEGQDRALVQSAWAVSARLMELRSYWPPREQEPSSVTSQSNSFQGSPGLLHPCHFLPLKRTVPRPSRPWVPTRSHAPASPHRALSIGLYCSGAPSDLPGMGVMCSKVLSPGKPSSLTLCKITSPQLTVTCPPTPQPLVTLTLLLSASSAGRMPQRTSPLSLWSPRGLARKRPAVQI